MAPNIVVRGMVLLFALSWLLPAQGLPAEWEVRDLAIALAKQMDLLAPALARFDTANWQGAPAAYGEQREMAVREAGYAAAVARQVAEKPTGLGKTFELHLRLQSVESLVASLTAGARAYQRETPLDEPLDILSAALPHENKLRAYITDLAESKDQELAAIDAEAQRCRAEMLRVPGPAKPTPAPKRTRSNINTNPTK